MVNYIAFFTVIVLTLTFCGAGKNIANDRKNNTT